MTPSRKSQISNIQNIGPYDSKIIFFSRKQATCHKPETSHKPSLKPSLETKFLEWLVIKQAQILSPSERGFLIPLNVFSKKSPVPRPTGYDNDSHPQDRARLFCFRFTLWIIILLLFPCYLAEKHPLNLFVCCQVIRVMAIENFRGSYVFVIIRGVVVLLFP